MSVGMQSGSLWVYRFLSSSAGVIKEEAQ
jgi:hypothetical protein